MNPPALPADLRLGAAHLTVSDLDRSVAFYQDAAGLRQRTRDGGTAVLGNDADEILVLHEDPLAKPAQRHAGLFHVALLYPSRQELGRTALRIADAKIPLSGASDHGVSEALYLRDPDGNGLELYCDRPTAQWPAPAAGTGDRVGMFTRPLDLDSILADGGQAPAPRHAADGLTVGHLHLHVGALPQALAFYRDLLGLDLMTTYPEAAFMSAGGYHHHLAVNTWAGEGVSAAPPHTAGLREWTILVPAASDVTAVRDRLAAAGAPISEDVESSFLTQDPWGIALRIGTAQL